MTSPIPYPQTAQALALIRDYADPDLVQRWAADLRANADNQGHGAYSYRDPTSDRVCWCALGRLLEMTETSAVRLPTCDAGWLELLGADRHELPAHLADHDSAATIFWGIARLNDPAPRKDDPDPDYLGGLTFPEIADQLLAHAIPNPAQEQAHE